MQSTANVAHETFIPCRRTDLVEMIVQDGRLSPADQETFRKFSTLLAAYYHFQFHSTLETLKQSYAPFDPNNDLTLDDNVPAAKLEHMEQQVVTNFRTILEKANYRELSSDSLAETLEQQSLVSLRTEINFDDFKNLICYFRGESLQTLPKQRFSLAKEREIEILDRVVLLIQYQDESYFTERDVDLQTLNFRPGQIYLYFYKEVPKLDLELLFPNVRTRMTLKDQLMLFVPATGMGIVVLVRILPQVLLILGVLLFIFEAPDAFNSLKATESESSNLMPVLISTFSLAIALGGFGFKQYSKYKSKRIQFQKKVTETLFFRNIANHSAVFQMFIDVAEEEECKEILLAYYQLLVSKEPLTVETLDHEIEQWLEAKLNERVNFDVEDAVQKLTGLREETADGLVQFLTVAEDGVLKVLSLGQANRLVDRLWDQAFDYS
ncbi:MAG: TMEM143 family protein [Cyanobacteria bacterium P01_F01_bin.42]